MISDTHGLMRPEALDALRGSHLIIHAGDVGRAIVLEELRKIAPVVAVKGNVDKEAELVRLPATEMIETPSGWIYVLHDLAEIDLDPVAAGIRAVISGHSHQPAHSDRAGIMYINPGSAGPRRFRLPITVARLDLRKTPWSVDFVDLSG